MRLFSQDCPVEYLTLAIDHFFTWLYTIRRLNGFLFKETLSKLIPFMVRQALGNRLPFVLDCMDAGGRATHGAVAESLSKNLIRGCSSPKL
jgi:hypothetical protein